MVKPVDELCLLSSLLDCPPAEVNIDLHLTPVQVTGDDVRHNTTTSKTGGHRGCDDICAGVSAIVNQWSVLCSLPGGDDVPGVGAVEVSPLSPADICCQIKRGREGGEDTSLVLSQPASVRYRDDEAAVSLVPGQHQLLTTSQPQPQLQSGRVKHQPSVLDVCVGENHNRAGLTALSSFVCLTAFTGLDCTVHTSHHRPESRGKFLTDLLPNTRERVQSFCKEEENLNKNKIPSEE